MRVEEIAERLQPLLGEQGLWRDVYADADRARLFAAIELLRPRVKKLGDFIDGGRFFFSDEVAYDPAAVEKHLRVPHLADHVAALRDALASIEPFDRATIEESLRSLAAERVVKPAGLIHATRVAATGRAASPGLFEVLELLGRARTIARLDQLVGFLRRSS
jgi:glutamyl-tRNA synthetase